MKIVNIIGGLGNQMFQYALVVALERKFGEPVYVDTSLFNTYRVHNGLEIERIFGIRLRRAPESELRRLTRYTDNFKLRRLYRKLLPLKKSECLEAKDYTLNDSVLTLDTDRYYDGYWQNYQYFSTVSEELRHTFKFILPIIDSRNTVVLDAIRNSSCAVGLHVRRGDYLKSSKYTGLCGLDYYARAIDEIKRKFADASFFIFSDDIQWCRNNLQTQLGSSEQVYVDWNSGTESYMDMRLMSECRHNIIANSSFSWWAAWLNPHSDRIVIAPEKWTNTKINFKIQMPDWIVM